MASRFRKVFVVCENNQTFGQVTQITIYKYRDHADYACIRAQKKAVEEHNRYANEHKPLPKYKVHGFYLVHEDVLRD